MSISIEQVLADAKRLVERLRSHDTAADALIQQTTGLNKRIETMTEFQEEIEEMNNIARHRPRTALILGIQRENRQIRQLQEENAELVASLKQHQAALDLIMSSYREQITRIRSAHKSEQDLLEKHSHETQESSQYIQKILEMAAVMQRAATSDESYCFQMEEMVSKLEYENQGLRELLRITKSVAKSVVSGPSSPQSAQSDDSSSKEQTSILHNRTVILSSPTLGISNKVEIKSPDPEPQEGAVVISEKVQTSVEAQGDHSSKASRPNPVDEVDTREESGGSGGTRVGGGGTLDLMAQEEEVNSETRNRRLLRVQPLMQKVQTKTITMALGRWVVVLVVVVVEQ
ncbi:putative FGFR1 oncogene partner 2-like [Apostichopus japonicus]|uniref:Putative FGFR1 oncogene partner 2-like n=1 Tax=Stichopus japonicus TaxID=307972 RepID=A0A2G8JR71_STIJA|nr:putative FGFR1 oncogene partner 2-like [Apostichopus japonicus]